MVRTFVIVFSLRGALLRESLRQPESRVLLMDRQALESRFQRDL